MPTLSEDQKVALTLPFTDEEIKTAVFSMKPYKSLGPDGYPPMFFQKQWDMVGADVCKSVKSFF